MRLSTRAGLCLALVPVLLLSLSSAYADTRDEKRKVDRKISDIKDDLEDSGEDLETAIHALHAAEAKLTAAQDKVAVVHGQLAAAQARDRMLGVKLDNAQAEVDEAQGRIDTTQAHITHTEDVIGQIARSSYQAGGLAELAVVLDSQSPDDFATRVVLVQNAMRSQGQVLTDLADAKADLAAQRATLDAKRAAIAEVKAQQEAIVATITGLEQQALAAQHDVEAMVSTREGLVSDVESERAAQKARLDQAERESKALAKKIAREAAKASGGGVGPGGLAWPADGRISTYAGFRINPVTGWPSCHSGIDIAPGYGAPIRAAASGVVVATTYTSWDGNTTIIAHGGGMTTWYAHQDSFGVHVGQQVSRGQVIGRVGSTGFATGPHLHFNVAIGDTAMDPMGWFGGPRRTVASLCPNGPSPVL